MSKRDKKKTEQDRRRQSRKKQPSSPFDQAKDNKSRVDYMMENYPRIVDGVKKFKSENDGQMPAIIMLIASGQHIIMADKLEPFVAKLDPASGLNLEVLKRDMVKREYTDDDCLLMVDAGRGILRTSFANAKLRHDLGTDGPELVSIPM